MNNAQAIPLNCGSFIGTEAPVYNFTKPKFGGDYFSIVSQPFNRTVSSSSITTTIFQDLQNIVSSGATTITDYNILIDQFLPNYYDYNIMSLNSGVILAPVDGVASGVSAGSTNLLVMAKNNSEIFTTINVTIDQNIGTTNTVFDTYASGSLSKYISDNLDSRLSGLNPISSKPIFTTQNHSSPLYIRNSGCWASDIDLTCISPWNSTGITHMAGTLISPRHIIFADHFSINNGATIRFVDNNNNIITRTLINRLRHPSWTLYRPDIIIGVLDSDVPDTIGFAKILPPNWHSYLPNLSLMYRLPCLSLDQEKKALVYELYTLSDIFGYFVSPTNSTRSSFYEKIVLYDSGCPSFLIINDELVIITIWLGSTSGPNIAYYKNDINSLMNTHGGYSLTEIDLSNFNTY